VEGEIKSMSLEEMMAAAWPGTLGTNGREGKVGRGEREKGLE
jgi:hypothetical protein